MAGNEGEKGQGSKEKKGGQGKGKGKRNQGNISIGAVTGEEEDVMVRVS